MFEERRRKLNELLAKNGYDVALIDSPWNLYYYSGFSGGEAMLVMPVGTGNSTEDICIITDSRYYEQVEKECPDIALVRLENSTYIQTVDELINKYYDKCGRNDGKIVVEETMNLSRYLKLKEVLEGKDDAGKRKSDGKNSGDKVSDDKVSNDKGCVSYKCQLVVDSSSINECRMVKDEGELELLRRAEAIGDAAFTHILDIIKPGMTERDIALELEFFMKRQGASKLSFDTIVASGPNSSMPHAQVTDRIIQKGDFVTMDFGCVYKGYCSDMTRTVAVGEPTEEMRKVYQIVLDANLRAMEGIRAGVRCCDIDALARDYIRDKGYGEYFGHGLGHSVGLEIHEEPRFSPKCDVVTRAGMAITDEPGIYLPGKFGVRIEDLVIVNEDGCERLSKSQKELIVL